MGTPLTPLDPVLISAADITARQPPFSTFCPLMRQRLWPHRTGRPAMATLRLGKSARADERDLAGARAYALNGNLNLMVSIHVSCSAGRQLGKRSAGRGDTM